MRSKKASVEHYELARYISDSVAVIRKAIHEQLSRAFDAGEVTPVQRLAMQVLVREGPISIKELASRLSLSHSTVSALMQRLEKRGMIARTVDPADARVSRVGPSAATTTFLRDQTRALLYRPLAERLQNTSPEDRQLIRRALERLRAILDQ